MSNEIVGFYHYPMPLKVAYEFSSNYYEFQGKSFNIMISGLSALKHISHEIEKSINFIRVLDEHHTCSLVRNK